MNTEVIAGEGMIVTAGAIDCHVHFICPQLAHEAIASGETSLLRMQNWKRLCNLTVISYNFIFLVKSV